MSLEKLADWAGFRSRSIYFVGGLLFGILILLAWSAWPHTSSNQQSVVGSQELAGRDSDSWPLTPRPSPDDGPAIRFRDLAASSGVSFNHVAGFTDMHYFPEVMGGGVAWIDFDQDG